MTRVGKTFKDQRDRKEQRGVKELPRHEKGGHRNLIREAEDEQWDELSELVNDEDEDEY